MASNKFFQGIIVLALIIGAFMLGTLWNKVQFLEKQNSALQGSNAQAPGTANPAAAQPQQQAPALTLDQIKSVFKKNVIKFGEANKKVLFVEVSDPSCPYCHVAAGLNGELNKQISDRFKLVADGGTYIAPVPEMRKLVEQGKASFAFIYYPGHGNGEMGTKAMYCAFDKGKFWQVHDLIMTNEGYNLLNNTVQNDKSKSEQLAQFLKSAMDPTEMKSCLDSGKYDQRISSDKEIASGLGISGTPGFFVNATSFAGAYSYKDIEPTVKDALAK